MARNVKLPAPALAVLAAGHRVDRRPDWAAICGLGNPTPIGRSARARWCRPDTKEGYPLPKFDNQDKAPILGKDPILSPAGAEARVLPAAGVGIAASASLAAAQPGTAAAIVA